MKHLLKLGGMTPEEILHILDVADEYKRLLLLCKKIEKTLILK